jgi:hypothetical protein
MNVDEAMKVEELAGAASGLSDVLSVTRQNAAQLKRKYSCTKKAIVRHKESLESLADMK